jgi:hypothetical protein
MSRIWLASNDGAAGLRRQQWVWPKGRPNHPLGPGGVSATPRLLVWGWPNLGPGQMGWPATPYGGVSATPAYFSSFFFKKK